MYSTDRVILAISTMVVLFLSGLLYTIHVQKMREMELQFAAAASGAPVAICVK